MICVKIILFCLLSYLGLSSSRVATKVRGTDAYEQVDTKENLQDENLRIKKLQDRMNKYLMFPYPKPDVDGKLSGWENITLVSTESVIEKTSFVGLVNVQKEYLIKFSFKPKNIANFGVVLNLYGGAFKVGDGGPAFFIQDNKVIVVTFINGKQLQWPCSTPKANEWNDIEYSQQHSLGNQYVQTFILNGAICYKPRTNSLPGLRTGVSIYGNDPWHKVCDGWMRNLILGSRPEVKYGHMKVTYGDGFPSVEFLDYGKFTGKISETIQKPPRKVPYSLNECLEICHKAVNHKAVRYTYTSKQCYCVMTTDKAQYKKSNTDLLYMLRKDTEEVPVASALKTLYNEMNKYLVYPYPKPDVDGKISGWEHTTLLSEESLMQKTSFLGLVNIRNEYLINFSFKPKNVVKVGVVLNLYGGGRRTGDGGPSFFIQNNQVIAITFTNGKQVQWSCSSPKLNQWNNVEYSQELSDGNQYFQKFTLNGADCGKPHINRLPGLRTGVSTYVDDPWHPVCDGSIKNVIFSSRPQVKYGHMKVIYGDGTPFAQFLDYGTFTSKVSETIQSREVPYSLGECLNVCHKETSYNAVRYKYTTKQCYCGKTTGEVSHKGSDTDVLYRLRKESVVSQYEMLYDTQDATDKHLVFPYPKLDVDGKPSGWETTTLVSTESVIEKTTFVELVNIEKEYLVKFSFKPKNVVKFGAVLDLSAHSNKVGDGGPSFFLQDNKVIAVTFINGNQVQWKCSPPKVNQWNDIEFSQERSVGDQYFQKFTLNGVKCGNPVNNMLPGLRTGVSIYVNDPWHKPCDGLIRNLIFGSRPQVKYGHMKVTYADGIPFAEFVDYGEFTGKVKSVLMQPKAPRKVPYSLGECLEVCHRQFQISTMYQAVRYKYTTKQCYCVKRATAHDYKDNNTDLLYMLRYDTF